jgi:hypothetical protein
MNRTFMQDKEPSVSQPGFKNETVQLENTLSPLKHHILIVKILAMA